VAMLSAASGPEVWKSASKSTRSTFCRQRLL
jgi:hypothetical protein